MALALECCADHGGTWEVSQRPDQAVGNWREAFVRAPYLRDTFVAMGILSETFETAITWDRFEAFHAEVLARTAEAVREVCGAGSVTCRFTHIYPDGPAPYFTVLAPARQGAELEQWAAIKAAPRATPCSRPAGRSPTTTRSAGTTGPGTTASARLPSPPLCGPPSASWIRRGR